MGAEFSNLASLKLQSHIRNKTKQHFLKRQKSKYFEDEIEHIPKI